MRSRLWDTALDDHGQARRFRMPFPEGFGKAKYGGVGRSREGPGKVPGRGGGRSAEGQAEGRLKVRRKVGYALPVAFL